MTNLAAERTGSGKTRGNTSAKTAQAALPISAFTKRRNQGNSRKQHLLPYHKSHSAHRAALKNRKIAATCKCHKFRNMPANSGKMAALHNRQKSGVSLRIII
jgi:hypothetical protein